MNPDASPNQWMASAQEDYQSALEYFQFGCAYETIGHKCHQAIEKALKSILAPLSDPLFKSHDLPLLARYAEPMVPALNTIKNQLALVNRFYLEMTYPDDLLYNISKETVSECLETVKIVFSLLAIENSSGSPNG